MLREATDYFISNNFSVTLIARDIEKLNYFKNNYPEKNSIDLISQDYCDTPKFIKAVKENITEHGAFDIVICWIHSKAENSLLQLINTLEKYNNTTPFYHIKGSSSVGTKSALYTNKLDYREIFLGFKIDNNNSRWLTHAEISNGIIKAFVSNKKKYIVGQIKPLG